MWSDLIRKDPDAGKDWRQEEKGTTEDEMVRWHYWLNGREFEQTPGGGEGQGSLVYCSPWGCKETQLSEQQLRNLQASPNNSHNFQVHSPSYPPPLEIIKIFWWWKLCSSTLLPHYPLSVHSLLISLPFHAPPVSNSRVTEGHSMKQEEKFYILYSKHLIF